MTLPYDFFDESQEQDQPESGYEGVEPIPVKVVYTETENVAAEFTALSLVPIAQAGSAGLPSQLVTHRYHRDKAKFTTTIPAGTVLYLATKPDALQSIAPAAAAPAGFIYALGPGQQIPDYEGQQPLYAVFSGAGPVSVAVMDMSYGKVQ